MTDSRTANSDIDPAKEQVDDLLAGVTGGVRGTRVLQKPISTAEFIGRPARPVLAIDED